jgi:hypothetical protein
MSRERTGVEVATELVEALDTTAMHKNYSFWMFNVFSTMEAIFGAKAPKSSCCLCGALYFAVTVM